VAASVSQTFIWTRQTGSDLAKGENGTALGCVVQFYLITATGNGLGNARTHLARTDNGNCVDPAHQTLQVRTPRGA